MGVFHVKVQLRNWQNKFLPEEKRGEEIECDALVDSGATELALPVETISRLRLEEVRFSPCLHCRWGEHKCRVFGIVEIEVAGRTCQVRAIELPRGAEPNLFLGLFLLKRWIGIYHPKRKSFFPIHVLPKSHFCLYVDSG